MNKKAIIKTLKGYKQAESFIESEKITNLQSLTSKDALVIYRELWKVWEKSKKSGDIQALDRLKIEYLIKRRQAFDRLAKWRKSA